MGFTSAGRGKGSTFFFELPLYSTNSASEGHDNSVEMSPSLLGPSEEPIGQPISQNSNRRLLLDGRIPVVNSEKNLQKSFDFDQLCLLQEAVDKDVGKDDESFDAFNKSIHSKEQTDLTRCNFYIVEKDPLPLSEDSPNKVVNRVSRKNLVLETEASIQASFCSELDTPMITPNRSKSHFVFDEGEVAKHNVILNLSYQ